MTTTTTSIAPQLPGIPRVPPQARPAFPGGRVGDVPRDALDRALDGLLRPLGLVGLWRVALPLLAAQVLGEGILLVGGIGTAKTLLARRWAQAFGARRLRVYDASKAQLEDVLGFPVPQSLAEGEVRYAPTPISLPGADALFLDELSRATPGMQSKWLEVIRGRTLLGLPLPELRLVLAAMNPLGYDGTYPLDEALAGRFAAVVEVPAFGELSLEERRAVIGARGDDDAPALSRAARATRTHDGEGEPDGAARLREVVRRARDRVELAALRARDGEPDPESDVLVAWADGLAQGLAQGGVVLDGRRLGMLHRMARAALAVARELTPEPGAPEPGVLEPGAGGPGAGAKGLEGAGDVLLRVLRGGLPFAATGRAVGLPLVRAVHEVAFAAANGKRGLGLWAWPSDPLELPAALRAASGPAAAWGGGGRAPHERQEAITRLLERAHDGELDPEPRAHALLALALVARDVTRGAVDLPADDRHRVLEAHAALLCLRDATPVERGPSSLELLSPRRALCVRVARAALGRDDSTPWGRGRRGGLRPLLAVHGGPPGLGEPNAVHRLASDLEHRLGRLLAEAA